jgi:hypothetical protein
MVSFSSSTSASQSLSSPSQISVASGEPVALPSSQSASLATCPAGAARVLGCVRSAVGVDAVIGGGAVAFGDGAGLIAGFPSSQSPYSVL